MQVDAAGEQSYATTAAGLLISPDNGDSWRLLDNEFSGEGGDGPTTHLHGLAVPPGQPDIVYVGSGRGGTDGADDVFDEVNIWRSTDGGETWVERSGGLPTDADTTIIDLEVHPEDPTVVYAATNAEDFGDISRGVGVGLWKSTDGGRNWFDLEVPAKNFNAVSIPTTAPETVYASSPNGVFRSKDGGSQWTSVLSHQTKALLASPSLDGVVFAGSRKFEDYWDVLISRDSGESWVEGDLTIQIGLEPNQREYDAAAIHSDYWARRGQIMWFDIDTEHGLLYGATRGAGLWRADITGLKSKN